MLGELFITFAKIGAFTFGGGYAMLALIEDECVEKKKWITHEELATVTAIAESTPGPIAINCATYTGYRKAGIAGAVSATIGMILPSFLIIYFISLFLDGFLEITIVAKAFKGIKIAVGILIAQAAVNMWRKKKKDKQAYIIAGAAFVAMVAILIWKFPVSTIVLIVAAGLSSVCIFAGKKLGMSKGGTAT